MDDRQEDAINTFEEVSAENDTEAELVTQLRTLMEFWENSIPLTDDQEHIIDSVCIGDVEKAIEQWQNEFSVEGVTENYRLLARIESLPDNWRNNGQYRDEEIRSAAVMCADSLERLLARWDRIGDPTRRQE